jgi:aspartyl-tRNA(Asn)/glutamyl-tRNA(Gln) amidotransferase subunit A
MARSAVDVAVLWRVLEGYDAGDPRAVRRPAARAARPERLRLGVAGGFFVQGLEPEIERAVAGAVEVFRGLGASVRALEIPAAEEAREICLLIIRADANALHRARLAERPDLIGEDIRTRIALGAEISGPDYSQMEQRMLEWRRATQRLFADVDVIVTPTTNAVAPRLEESETIATTEQLTRFTYPWSAAAVPALSLPCGLSSDGLPIGVQLAAAPWREELLLEAAAAFQRETDWHRRRPPLA